MTLDNRIAQAASLLNESQHAVALTGAGMSTPSGIPDFRSRDSGLWRSADPLEVASIYAFRSRPQDFFEWIRPFAKLILEAQPNAAHKALSQMEALGLLKVIITQNIDMLDSRAGSPRILEVHGNLRRATCIRCYAVYPAQPFLEAFIEAGEIPICPACGGVLKPDVILFGEQLPVRVMNEARKQARLCDLMLIAGSSLEVAPAGDLPLLAIESGARLIIVNNEPTYMDEQADVVLHADVVDVLPELVAYLVTANESVQP